MNEEEIQCRYDFYQSSQKINLNIYAKGLEKEKSKATFESNSVSKNKQNSLFFKKGFSFFAEIWYFVLRHE